MKEDAWMNYIISGLLLVAAMIHLMPLAGLLSTDNLQRLYGIAATEGDLLILLRHRAVLFGLLGGLILASVFLPQWRWLAIAAGLVSALSFILIAAQSPAYGAAITRVIMADWMAVGCLCGAAVLLLMSSVR
jgi:hypothetical protein